MPRTNDRQSATCRRRRAETWGKSRRVRDSAHLVSRRAPLQPARRVRCHLTLATPGGRQRARWRAHPPGTSCTAWRPDGTDRDRRADRTSSGPRPHREPWAALPRRRDVGGRGGALPRRERGVTALREQPGDQRGDSRRARAARRHARTSSGSPTSAGTSPRPTGTCGRSPPPARASAGSTTTAPRSSA